MRLLLALVCFLGPVAGSLHTAKAQVPGQTLVFPTSIQWPRQRGVTWYRLQIGGDETFRDVHFDRRVLGDRFSVRELAPGYYFWRIAPADNRLGEFSRPLRFFVPGGVVTSYTARNSIIRGPLTR
ncbi:MAG TPA: hypothetical protein VNO50_22690 [Pyrinomonadaceae bacterium]|nr:hypothetical protein [Pyrinomonadaceae bacterium]